MSRKVLVIDDDPFFRELIIESLANHFKDFIVDEAGDGTKAAQMIEDMNIFDLILLDYRMPKGYTGLDFLERVKHLLEDTSVIMITGEGDEEVAATAFRLGVTDYFIKGPNLISKLMERVVDVISRMDNELEYKSTNPNSAYSRIEMIKKYQAELDKLNTSAAIQGESMLLEFREITEFNKFSRLVKFLQGVKVMDTKILDNRYVLHVSLKSTRFQRISSIS